MGGMRGAPERIRTSDILSALDKQGVLGAAYHSEYRASVGKGAIRIAGQKKGNSEMKEDILEQIEKLRNEYEYWFEIFRREKAPANKEEARKKYQYAIGEIIRLQDEYHVRSVPKYSSGERARMNIDHQKQKLELSQDQIHEKRLEEEFAKEKSGAEEDQRNKITDSGDKYINSVLDEMRDHHIDLSAILASLTECGSKPSASELDRALRLVLLASWLSIRFVKYFSGEVYIETFFDKYAQAERALADDKLTEADAIMQEALMLYDEAVKYSQFSSGPEYFRLEKARKMTNWEETRSSLLERESHDKRQEQLKPIIAEMVLTRPGLLQTDLYKAITEYSRSEVSEAAYYMSKGNKLSRRKKGNTYELFIP